MAQITLNSSGVASSGSLLLQTNGTTTQATVDTSGNLGLGVTPSAWTTYTTNFQNTSASLASNGVSTTVLGTNWYYDGQNRYRGTGLAALYFQTAGQHAWFTAASGTAGNILSSLTQAMTLDASGNLGVGTSSPSTRLHLAGVASPEIRFTSSSGPYSYFESNTAGSVGIAADEGNTGSSSNINFRVDGAERARIDSSGNLLVGTTSTGNARILGDGGSSYHGVRGTVTAAGNVGIYGNHSSNSATGYVAYFHNTGSGTGLYISNTAAWQSVSDSRLKEDVRDLNTTSKLLQLRPVDYLWKNQATSDEPEKRSLGFIAQEVQELFPELVGVSPDGFLSVEYTGLIAPLVKAIQEQQAIITQLQADVAALKGQA